MNRIKCPQQPTGSTMEALFLRNMSNWWEKLWIMERMHQLMQNRSGCVKLCTVVDEMPTVSIIRQTQMTGEEGKHVEE